MHLVFVAPFGLQPKSTARVRALPLGAALVARGHRVTLVVPPWDDRAHAGQTFTHQGVTVMQLPVPRTALLDLPFLTLRLWQTVHALKPDLLHIFKPKAYSGFIQVGWWLWQRLGQTRVPVVLDSDDWEGKGGWNDHAPYSPPAKALFAWQEQWGLTHADGVTVASRALAEMVAAMGIDPTHLLFAPNGPGAAGESPPATDAEVLALRTRLGIGNAPTALLYTRFFEFDVVQMARRWAAIVRELPTARLVVVGKGLAEEEHTFQQALAVLGVAESVRDVGWQPFNDLAPYFALADVALYPMQESLLNRTKCPVKLADYMQMGRAVVGDAVGMVKEYLAEGAGWLVPPDDDEAFVTATIALLQDKARAKAMGAVAQQRLAAHFSWAGLAAQMERFYNTVLQHK